MQLRARLDCSVSISDCIEESVNQRLSSPSGGPGLINESNAGEVVERYRRLLQVVLGNWWYTEWIVRAYLAQHVDTASGITLYDAGLEEQDEKELIPLILSQLSSEDADFFRRVCDDRWLLLQDDPFWDCFKFELSSAPEIEE